MSEEVINKTGSVEDVLKLINRTNETFIYSVWVPSLNKEIMFRELNTSQQKRLVKAVIDSSVYNTEFIFAMRQILNENCADKSVDIGDLTLLDKLFITLKMRSVSIGDTFEIEIAKDPASLSKVKRGISLQKIIDDAKKTLPSITNSIISDDTGAYSLECSLPTIKTEYRLEDEIRQHLSSEINDKKELKNIIGDTFASELAKYINVLNIKETDKITKINLDDLSFKNRITLIERLPAKLLNKVTDYASELNKKLNDLTLFKVSYENDKGETIEKEERLTIDASFFMVS